MYCVCNTYTLLIPSDSQYGYKVPDSTVVLIACLRGGLMRLHVIMLQVSIVCPE